MKVLNIHTFELTKDISYPLYKQIRDFLFNSKERCHNERNVIKYDGFATRGIRLQLIWCKPKKEMQITRYLLKYIITPSRFINPDDYLGLTEVAELLYITDKIGVFLFSQCELLPHPLDCGITRIDLTKDLYAGNNTDYLITLLNRSYIPYKWERLYQCNKCQATFTKINLNGKKIVELSAYDKYKELESHINNSGYDYLQETMDRAKGILRIELRIYNLRLKNLEKKYHWKTPDEFFCVLEKHLIDIVADCFKKLYLAGSFYKLDTILEIIELSSYQQKTKNKMREFIRIAAKHKSVQTASNIFEDKYGEKKLKDMLKKFNAIGIIPNPISRRQLIDEWDFFEFVE